MDVETQMESKGLPLQFNSTSDQPQGPHIIDNEAASISNSTASVTAPPAQQTVIEASQTTSDSAPAVTEVKAEKVPDSGAEAVSKAVEETQPPSTEAEVTASETAQNHISTPISTIPDSQPPPTSEDTGAPSTTSVSDSKTTESVVPSSIPAEIQSSETTIEVSQPAMEVSDPLPAVPAQAPVSDQRTSPHADALTPDAVANVAARKHELDNGVVDSAAPAKSDVMDTSFPTTVPPTTDSTNRINQTPVANTGLPSPPAQSPPSAPQLSSATLTEEKPTEQLVEAPKDVSAAPVSAPAPSEQPKEPAPTPAVSAPTESQDQVMQDVSSQPVKQFHERDEHDDGEPAAKRVKTEEPQASQQAEFKVPDVPAPSTPQATSLVNGNSATPASANVNGITDGDDTVTPARLAHMKKVISNLKKSNASAAFRLPVDPVALNIPTYFEVIKHPMDLGTIDQRLKRNEYTSVAAFISDFELIVDNCVKFNGPDHGVTQAARKMQSSFNSQMRNLPKASIEEPPKDNKKAAKKLEPTRTAPPRRPSVSTTSHAPASHPTPKASAPPTPSFAPGPDGIPLIRRDSTLADGRPKRAIVPTKRNQEFGGGRPKKKKYELQLKFCDEVLKELTATKYWPINQYFTHPVDPVALNIPTYFQIIKKPMDLGTIRTKLNNNVYEKAKDFEEDVRLVFKNCYKFNPEGDLVNSAGHQLEELFNKKWATKDDWIAAREPQSEPQSDAEAEDDEEEESEEDADDSEEERNDKIKLLQKQIEEMSKQMGELTQKKHKKSKSPPTKKTKAKTHKKDKPAANFPNLGKDKKEKKKSAPKSKVEKDRYVTFAEKQYISNGIAMLPEKQMQEALKIIQNSVPSLTNSDQNEIELDIEEVPNHALLKLLNFVKKYAGPPPEEPKAAADPTDVYAPTQKSKKSKPMSKHEQQAQIEELKGKLGAYQGAMSPNAVPSIEAGDSSDDGDSEESEEE
ncbi:transcription initiation at TATA-containing promoter protein [Exophiala dermatitidis]|uniref:Bromodomain-containing protein n=2 Tax=Exophiala dermatitidis TaxID=5970 RepID=H6C9C3_EXODN|nr:bromodomain-containing protein [Exophiala dermatitidis NIH/UT8656]KAJ4524831.1 transcription initiation at TATA-containing promoter protein [Exophiala dermatitidis]EHY60693.1 bromodomain-containing protein [Exophiala dermatitidis NIH/UT8656]KAJ4527711.1 transcription initiation at TATA-containing promoter protein [Exophiala dermatitidis]KAJ4528347.1 transcription initiation at TATA-containing promoter protein [Exophiala dermatitidis]KAJ4531297.1 transcription initiation at TATA-containing p